MRVTETDGTKTLEWVKFDRESYEKVKTFVGSRISPMIIPRSINGVASCMLEEDKCFMTIREGDFIVKTNDGRFKKASPGLIKQLKDLTE